jgi:hypothetical protein
MPLSSSAEGLAFEAAADEAVCEGKVRGGISLDKRRSSTRLLLDEEAAAAAAAADADSLQAAAGQLAEVPEGKVRGGSRRGSYRCLSDEAEVAAAVAEAIRSSSSEAAQQQQGIAVVDAMLLTKSADAATASTWQSKLKGAAGKAGKVAFAAANSVSHPFTSSSSSSSKLGTSQAASAAAKQQQRQKQHSQPLPQIEANVRGGQAKAARLRGSASTPDLPSLAAARAAADAAFDEAAVSSVRAKLTSSSSAWLSWDGASSSSAASSVAAAAAAPRGIPMPSRIKGMGKKLSKLHRKPHSGGRGAGSIGSSSNSRSSDMLVLGGALNMSGCSILSNSSGANSRGSSIEVSFSSPQGPAAAAVPHSLLQPSGLADVAEAAAACSVQPQQNAAAGSSGSSLISAFSSAAGTAAAASPGTSAAAAAGCADISRGASSCMSEACEGSFADGAVHEGELGATALEGQMHGGKRSSSLVSTRLHAYTWMLFYSGVRVVGQLRCSKLCLLVPTCHSCVRLH